MESVKEAQHHLVGVVFVPQNARSRSNELVGGTAHAAQRCARNQRTGDKKRYRRWRTAVRSTGPAGRCYGCVSAEPGIVSQQAAGR